LPSFGEKLKLEREKRKISLDQISSTTKIGTRMLQALEEEKFAQLPGGIFNKGFVRAYARALGLDEDQAVADYLEASGEAQPMRPDPLARDTSRETSRDTSRDSLRENAPRTAPARAIARNSAPVRITDDNFGRIEIRAEAASRQLPWGIFAVVLLIIALALSLWSYRRREHDRLAHPTRVSSLSSPQQSAAQQSAARSNTLPQQSASPNAALQPSQAGAQQNPSTSPQPASASSSQENVTTVPGEFLVLVHALGESWLSPVVDGKPIGSETMRAGDTRSFRAHQRVTVKAGNASVLEFRLNGKLLTIPPDPGQSNSQIQNQVKTITLGPTGIIPTVTSDIPAASQ
jgi:cytoskeleton protein RodZ